jgi:hypothetical protein
MATHPHSGEAVAVRTPDIHSPKRFGQLAGGEQGAQPYTTVQSVYESQEWSGGAMPQF